MPGDVTMKDLQSLQGFVNNKLKEMQGKVDGLAKSVESINKSLDAFRTANNIQAEEIAKLRNEASKAVAGLNDILGQHAKSIAALQKG